MCHDKYNFVIKLFYKIKGKSTKNFRNNKQKFVLKHFTIEMFATTLNFEWIRNYNRKLNNLVINRTDYLSERNRVSDRSVDHRPCRIILLC